MNMATRLGKLTKIGRFVLAVVLGAILGNALAVVAALGIDASYGRDITGGDWRLNAANVIYAAIIGLLVGLFAGTIAKARGWLAGAIAQFLPLEFVIGVSIYLNRDLLSNFHVKPALWAWIGLLPAVVGGYLGEQLTNDKETTDLLRSVGWHWSWLWAVFLVCLYSVAGSVRFLVADFALGWQIIFHPRLWLTAIIWLPIVSGLLWASFWIPSYGTVSVVILLGGVRNAGGERRSILLKSVLIAFGIPASLFVVFALNAYALAWFAGKGLWVP